MSLALTTAASTARAATIVPEDRRAEFLPALFRPRHMLIGEVSVFRFMGLLAPQDYRGGFWNFFELDGKPLYLAPAKQSRFHLSCASNGFDGEMSADAAGIVATLFALSHLALDFEDEHLSDGYDRLIDYARNHSEAADIFGAID